MYAQSTVLKIYIQIKKKARNTGDKTEKNIFSNLNLQVKTLASDAQ